MENGMPKIRFVPLALALTLSATTNAWANINSSWGTTTATQCGGNTFSTCASVSVTLITSGPNAGRVIMTVTNLSGSQGTYAGTVFTQVGMYNLPAGVDYNTFLSATNCGADGICGGANAGDDTNVQSAWQLGTNGLSGAGIDPTVIGTDTKNGVNGAIATGQTFQFVFTITNWSSITSINDFAIHGQAGPNTCSTKLVWSGSSPNQPTASPDGSCDFSTVPEPISMALVGTGLMGMGGAGLLRRRKKDPELV